VTGVWLAALLTGQGWWLGALLFGYVVVVPLIALLFGDEKDRAEWWDDETADESGDRSEPTNRDALETLRDRYARGGLTDEQFERKLERLLETETVETTEDRNSEREGMRERIRDRVR
jgi:uncharacterized membrane protein